jgi:hypothetical protein
VTTASRAPSAHALVFGLAAGAALTVTTASPAARADDADVCMTAPVEGQTLQKAGKLLAARDKFTSCARKSCPTEIVQDCTRWAGDVLAALPTVVLAARDQAGHDLSDATVSIDDKPPVPVGARSTPIDPGSHKFVFRRLATGTGATVEQVTIVREGEKNREVAATFQTPDAAVPPPTVQERPIPAATWVSAAFGVAGFGVLGVAGGIGVANRASEHCDTGCTQSQKSGVDDLFHVADIGLGVGAAGVVLATVLFLARPTVERPAPPSPSATSAPVPRDFVVGFAPLPSGGAATLGGRF